MACIGFTHASTGEQPAHRDGDQIWQSCVEKLRTEALAQGISATTVQTVLDRINQLPRVISADKNQPEFTKTFTDYYRTRVTEYRVTKGRNLLASHAPLLARMQEQTGVPPQYLIALWGLETNFGSYFGKLFIPSALTTLACDSRRPAFFTRELLATLRIVDRGDIALEDLQGSWAGAIGHMQFMPTTYLQHAVDGDADGRKDLVGSIEDALLSGATYLAEVGWQPGFRWGREVLLPEHFDYAVSGLDQWRDLEKWRTLGVTNTSGDALPSSALQAALLLPSGYTGPAFLVYANFRVIMKWNRSQYYALSVGRLADRIAGAGRLSVPLPETRFSSKAMMALQRQLNQLGFPAGLADGILGPSTRSAIRAFQQQAGHPADGYPSTQLMNAVAVQSANAR